MERYNEFKEKRINNIIDMFKKGQIKYGMFLKLLRDIGISYETIQELENKFNLRES